MKALSYEVGYMLGIPIDYYASVNMLGFIEVVEQVGSVTVNNTRNIHDTTLEFDLGAGCPHARPGRCAALRPEPAWQRR